MLDRDILLELQKEIKKEVASAVTDNLRGLENALKQNCAEASNTIEEVCQEKLRLFTDGADARQQEMQQLIEEATKAQAEQMRTIMEEHHAEVLGNKKHHQVLNVLQEKDRQLENQQE